MTVGEALNSVDRLTNSNDWGLIWSDAIPVLAGEVRRLMKENDELDEECTRRQLRIYEQLERVGIGDRKRPPQCHCSGLYSMICYKDRTYCTYYNCVNASPKKCSRTLTREVKEAADKFGLPVCVYAAKPECFIQDLDYQEGY